MRVGSIADPHIGNHKRFGGEVVSGLNARCRFSLEALNRAVEAAKKSCDLLVVLGDLFDTASPEPQVIRAVQEALEPIPTVVLKGNHDMFSEQFGDNALGPLKPVVTVVEKPTVLRFDEVNLVAVPFQVGPAKDWLPRVVDELMAEDSPNGKPYVLALHLGLEDESTAPWLKNSHDSVPASLVIDLCKKHGIRSAFAGNWHDHKEWGAVVQVGTLCPTGFDNPGTSGYGNLAVFDAKTDSIVYKQIPGPRFLKVDPAKDESTIRTCASLGNKVFVSCDAPPDLMDVASSYLEKLKSEGIVVDGEVLSEGAQEIAAAKAAASAARSAETISEALTAFIKEMPLEEGVDREKVLERAKGYLGAGG